MWRRVAIASDGGVWIDGARRDAYAESAVAAADPDPDAAPQVRAGGRPLADVRVARGARAPELGAAAATLVAKAPVIADDLGLDAARDAVAAAAPTPATRWWLTPATPGVRLDGADAPDAAAGEPFDRPQGLRTLEAPTAARLLAWDGARWTHALWARAGAVHRVPAPLAGFRAAHLADAPGDDGRAWPLSADRVWTPDLAGGDGPGFAPDAVVASQFGRLLATAPGRAALYADGAWRAVALPAGHEAVGFDGEAPRVCAAAGARVLSAAGEVLFEDAAATRVDALWPCAYGGLVVATDAGAFVDGHAWPGVHLPAPVRAARLADGALVAVGGDGAVLRAAPGGAAPAAVHALGAPCVALDRWGAAAVAVTARAAVVVDAAGRARAHVLPLDASDARVRDGRLHLRGADRVLALPLPLRGGARRAPLPAAPSAASAVVGSHALANPDGAACAVRDIAGVREARCWMRLDPATPDALERPLALAVRDGDALREVLPAPRARGSCHAAAGEALAFAWAARDSPLRAGAPGTLSASLELSGRPHQRVLRAAFAYDDAGAPPPAPAWEAPGALPAGAALPADGEAFAVRLRLPSAGDAALTYGGTAAPLPAHARGAPADALVWVTRAELRAWLLHAAGGVATALPPVPHAEPVGAAVALASAADAVAVYAAPVEPAHFLPAEPAVSIAAHGAGALLLEARAFPPTRWVRLQCADAALAVGDVALADAHGAPIAPVGYAAPGGDRLLIELDAPRAVGTLTLARALTAPVHVAFHDARAWRHAATLHAPGAARFNAVAAVPATVAPGAAVRARLTLDGAGGGVLEVRGDDLDAAPLGALAFRAPPDARLREARADGPSAAVTVDRVRVRVLRCADASRATARVGALRATRDGAPLALTCAAAPALVAGGDVPVGADLEVALGAATPADALRLELVAGSDPDARPHTAAVTVGDRAHAWACDAPFALAADGARAHATLASLAAEARAHDPWAPALETLVDTPDLACALWRTREQHRAVMRVGDAWVAGPAAPNGAGWAHLAFAARDAAAWAPWAPPAGAPARALRGRMDDLSLLLTDAGDGAAAAPGPTLGYESAAALAVDGARALPDVPPGGSVALYAFVEGAHGALLRLGAHAAAVPADAPHAWRHVLAARADGAVAVYVDGAPHATLPDDAPDAPLACATDFRGRVDDVAVYAVALTALDARARARYAVRVTGALTVVGHATAQGALQVRYAERDAGYTAARAALAHGLPPDATAYALRLRLVPRGDGDVVPALGLARAGGALRLAGAAVDAPAGEVLDVVAVFDGRAVALHTAERSAAAVAAAARPAGGAWAVGARDDAGRVTPGAELDLLVAEVYAHALDAAQARHALLRDGEAAAGVVRGTALGAVATLAGAHAVRLVAQPLTSWNAAAPIPELVLHVRDWAAV
jgi:hypothetical protein